MRALVYYMVHHTILKRTFIRHMMSYFTSINKMTPGNFLSAQCSSSYLQTLCMEIDINFSLHCCTSMHGLSFKCFVICIILLHIWTLTVHYSTPKIYFLNKLDFVFMSVCPGYSTMSTYQGESKKMCFFTYTCIHLDLFLLSPLDALPRLSMSQQCLIL